MSNPRKVTEPVFNIIYYKVKNHMYKIKQYVQLILIHKTDKSMYCDCSMIYVIIYKHDKVLLLNNYVVNLGFLIEVSI